MRRIRWQELRDIFKLAGFIEARIKGDHLMMTKPGVARPLVIKMDRDLGEDTIRTNMHTAGMDRKEFECLLDVIRRRRS